MSRSAIFVGHTQDHDAAHSFASDIGPYNSLSLGLDPTAICDKLQGTQVVPNYCLNSNDGISLPIDGFFSNQRMNNIYDGPSYQDSDVYLDTTTTPCGTGPAPYNSGCIYGIGLSLARSMIRPPKNALCAERGDRLETTERVLLSTGVPHAKPVLRQYRNAPLRDRPAVSGAGRGDRDLFRFCPARDLHHRPDQSEQRLL
jgi:hypothetical protein